MNFKYLLIASCKEDGYWDTSGHCHWRKPAFDYSEEFEKNEEGEKYLTEDLADILHKHPKCDHKIYVILDYETYEDTYNEECKQIETIESDAKLLARELQDKDFLKAAEEVKLRRENMLAEEERKDLAILKQLKEKYE